MFTVKQKKKLNLNRGRIIARTVKQLLEEGQLKMTIPEQPRNDITIKLMKI